MKNYERSFASRHIGVTQEETVFMLQKVGAASMDEFIKETIPSDILLKEDLKLPEAMSEAAYAQHIYALGEKNKRFTSVIGQGWYGTIMPAVVQRNILENPAWYTSYTPYQAEISQGRLEALINFQTMVSDLTGMELANSSLLDEATAAAEAVTMMMFQRSRAQLKSDFSKVLVDKNIFPETLAVMRTRGIPQGVELQLVDIDTAVFTEDCIGVVLQYPNSDGEVIDHRALTAKAHDAGAKVAVIADLLSLTLLTPPGEWGADIVCGSTQRMGIPRFFGGPSAGYFASSLDSRRLMPGRIIGQCLDRYGKPCFRLALQTREQHIKRERATSNICTAQALLATMAGFYVAYHGPEGLKAIAEDIHAGAYRLSLGLKTLGYSLICNHFFDTLRIALPSEVTVTDLKNCAEDKKINLRYFKNGEVGLSIDELCTDEVLQSIFDVFASAVNRKGELPMLGATEIAACHPDLIRTSPYLQHEVFNKYHCETEMMRYMKRLERKDISLAHSMIALGSCTMKLNAAQELLPLTQPGWVDIHPLVPADQTEGYHEMIDDLCKRLDIITGMADITLQPNSGAAGEYTGLRMIRSYLESIGQGGRKYVLIPDSAHGTNPASARQAGYEVIHCKCDDQGNVDVVDLETKVDKYADELAALMITYPSTHGIFEVEIRRIVDKIHAVGAQVYMDGANMNGQIGYTSPGFIGADVCHLNLHKSFASPHGGGGPGIGAVGMAKHMIPHKPSHVIWGDDGIQVASAPYGSAGLLSVTYGYICMMGTYGLKHATEQAILSANYIAEALKDTYGILYRGAGGYVGHELILECRKISEQTGLSENDIAKRLMDYGYHAPTLSFPVHGTLMIEPTESESLEELNRFILAMKGIWEELQQVVRGELTKDENPLANAPHPEYEAVANDWGHPYTRQQAVYPNEEVRNNKFWVNTARVNDSLGDRHLLPTRYGSLEEV
ncbi:MAG: aminomethyl-transferring glycine dehydrogenase [Bacteroidaceae bacterium]